MGAFAPATTEPLFKAGGDWRLPPRSSRPARSSASAAAWVIGAGTGVLSLDDAPCLATVPSAPRRPQGTAVTVLQLAHYHAAGTIVAPPRRAVKPGKDYSTVTVLARLRGWSTFSARAACDVVGEQLQRHHRQERLQQLVGPRARRRPARRARRPPCCPRCATANTRAPRARTSEMLESSLSQHAHVGRHAHHRRAL